MPRAAAATGFFLWNGNFKRGQVVLLISGLFFVSPIFFIAACERWSRTFPTGSHQFGRERKSSSHADLCGFMWSESLASSAVQVSKQLRVSAD